MPKHLGIQYGTMDEVFLLREHDEGEELHAFVPSARYTRVGLCVFCDDTAEGLMHNNTWRNVEPLMQ